MARSRVRSRAGGMSLDVEIEGLERTSREFKAVRQRVARNLRTVEQRAAEDTVLPEARQNASRFSVEGEDIGQHLVVRKNASGPELTTNFRGGKARAAGLLEFGGTVRTPLLPKNGRALVINGSPRASVRTARQYRARRFLQDAVEERLGAFGENVRDSIVDFFGNPFETD